MSVERHPAVDLDAVVHQRIRLGILGILREADEATFTYLREALAVTDGNLATHLQVLEDAGLVAIRKAFVGRKARTLVLSTSKGRATFDSEVDALRRIVERHSRS